MNQKKLSDYFTLKEEGAKYKGLVTSGRRQERNLPPKIERISKAKSLSDLTKW